MDRGLVKAVAHPMRVRILSELESRDTLSPVELAQEWHQPLGVVAYHFRRLRVLGFVEISRRTARRGAIQHHYRIRQTTRSIASRSDLEPTVRSAMLAAQLSLLIDDLDGAIDRGAFDSPSAWLGHSRLMLDAEGLRQLADGLRSLSERASDIALESRARIDAGESTARPAILALLLFEEGGHPERPAPFRLERRTRVRARRC